jgi:hypothetical protein
MFRIWQNNVTFSAFPMTDLKVEWEQQPFHALEYNRLYSVPVLAASISLFAISYDQVPANPVDDWLRQFRFGSNPPDPVDLIFRLFPDFAHDLDYFAIHSQRIEDLQDAFANVLEAIFNKFLKVPLTFITNSTPSGSGSVCVMGPVGVLEKRYDSLVRHGCVIVGRSGRLKVIVKHGESYHSYVSGRIKEIGDVDAFLRRSTTLLYLYAPNSLSGSPDRLPSHPINDRDQTVIVHSVDHPPFLEHFGDVESKRQILMYPYHLDPDPDHKDTDDKGPFPFPGCPTRRFHPELFIVQIPPELPISSPFQLVWTSNARSPFTPELRPWTDFDPAMLKEKFADRALFHMNGFEIISLVWCPGILNTPEDLRATIPLDGLIAIVPEGGFPAGQFCLMTISFATLGDQALTSYDRAPTIFSTGHGQTQSVLKELERFRGKNTIFAVKTRAGTWSEMKCEKEQLISQSFWVQGQNVYDFVVITPKLAEYQ